ncbi:hypothetical protein HJFPF1_06560 [Paramyrothecium foliicola]|nr:hypothetical protein HJFPF1_06560 [Paramyrothecium foliicola]
MVSIDVRKRKEQTRLTLKDMMLGGVRGGVVVHLEHQVRSIAKADLIRGSAGTGTGTGTRTGIESDSVTSSLFRTRTSDSGGVSGRLNRVASKRGQMRRQPAASWQAPEGLNGRRAHMHGGGPWG